MTFSFMRKFYKKILFYKNSIVVVVVQVAFCTVAVFPPLREETRALPYVRFGRERETF